MRNLILSLALVLASTGAYAGNDNANPCGNNGNNCQPSAPTYNDASANAGALAAAGAIGIGVGTGGDATATGGNASAIGTGGTAFGGAGGSVGDIRNTNSATGGSVLGSGNSTNTNVNTALGGAGGSAVQGQQQGQGQLQGQHQSNVGINGQQQGQSTDVATSTSTQQGQSQDASSQNANDNRSNASGNSTSTSVGGQSVSYSSSSTYVAKRNAPGAYAPSVYPTATCQKSISLGFSSLWGGGAAGGSYADKECQTVVLAQNLASIGMTDTACDVLKTSDTWARAVQANPDLANVSCRVVEAKTAEAIKPIEPAVWKYHTVIEGGAK